LSLKKAVKKYPKIARWTLIIFGFSLLVVLLFIYRRYNPYEWGAYFPKCVFHELTGLECPGCGSQRAIHFLLIGEFMHAIQENILVILAIPYLSLAVFLNRMKHVNNRFAKWHVRWVGRQAIYSILSIILIFWILRNIFLFPD